MKHLIAFLVAAVAAAVLVGWTAGTPGSVSAFVMYGANAVDAAENDKCMDVNSNSTQSGTANPCNTDVLVLQETAFYTVGWRTATSLICTITRVSTGLTDGDEIPVSILWRKQGEAIADSADLLTILMDTGATEGDAYLWTGSIPSPYENGYVSIRFGTMIEASSWADTELICVLGLE